MNPKLAVGTMNTLPLLSVSLTKEVPASKAAAMMASTSAADWLDSKVISRGLLVMPMRMSTRQDYDTRRSPRTRVLSARTRPAPTVVGCR